MTEEMNEQTDEPILHVGAIVHYVLAAHDANYSNECRPAIVVKIWDKETGCSQLQVFMDGDGNEYNNDGTPNVIWRTSILYSQDNEPSTWHWPCGV